MLVMDKPSENRMSHGLRRRSVGVDSTTPNLPLNLEVGFKIEEGIAKSTPSPYVERRFGDENQPSSSLAEFKMKQKSFDFEIQIEDCEEEELSAASSDEDTSRPHTPVQVLEFPDCGGNVTHKEQPPAENFLQVGAREQECLTDVSEGESENEDDTVDTNFQLPKRTVIKRVPH